MKKRKVDRVSKQGFEAALEGLDSSGQVRRAVRRRRGSRGRRGRVSAWQVIVGMVFHVMNGFGTLGEHFAMINGIELADSTLSGRRQALPWNVFERLMELVLQPRCERSKQPEAFYKSWRLVAIDGTQFSLTNTPQIVRSCTKATARRLRAAFAKLQAVVMLEIGAHNPIGAAIAKKDESEWELARRIIKKLPSDCLMLADRLYGCAAFAAITIDQCRAVGSEFLVRVRKQLKVRVLEHFEDGSALVEVCVLNKKKKRQVDRHLQLREIRARVSRPGWRTHEVRLWTSVLDPEKAPAEDLAKLYTKRWEQELYYRQMKLELRHSEVLQSHTLHTAAQEIAVLVIATALLAQERLRAAGSIMPALRVSFAKTMELLRPFWILLAIGDDLLSSEQRAEFARRLLCTIREQAMQPRRERSCPRAVRQPIKGWPRLTKNRSDYGELSYKIMKVSV